MENRTPPAYPPAADIFLYLIFFFFSDCGIAQYGISLWPLQVRCSSSAPHLVFCPPPTNSLQGEQSQKKSSLDVEQALCIGSQNTCVLPVLLQPQIQKPYGLLGRELTPSQPVEEDICAVSFCKAVIALIYRQKGCSYLFTFVREGISGLDMDYISRFNVA